MGILSELVFIPQMQESIGYFMTFSDIDSLSRHAKIHRGTGGLEPLKNHKI